MERVRIDATDSLVVGDWATADAERVRDIVARQALREFVSFDHPLARFVGLHWYQALQSGSRHGGAIELPFELDEVRAMALRALDDPPMAFVGADGTPVINDSTEELAFLALGHTGRAEDVAALRRQFDRSRTDDGSLQFAFLALAAIEREHPGALATVRPWLSAYVESDASPQLRGEALGVLTVLDDDATLAQLRALAAGEPSELAWTAAAALARRGDPQDRLVARSLFDRSTRPDGYSNEYVLLQEAVTDE